MQEQYHAALQRFSGLVQAGVLPDTDAAAEEYLRGQGILLAMQPSGAFLPVAAPAAGRVTEQESLAWTVGAGVEPPHIR